MPQPFALWQYRIGMGDLNGGRGGISRIDELSLLERAVLLGGASQWTTHAVPRAGIPAMVLADGPHGVRREANDGNALGGPRSHIALPATCFPTASLSACSWDPALMRRVGEALGTEARRRGVNVLLGPGLNIKRSPLCGRNFEYFSEDPLLAGRMAAGMVAGIQSQGVAACPKHFAANSQELRRQCSNSVIDAAVLRELYLTGFEIVVRQAHPWALMSSYNRINGMYAHEHRYLLQRVLRDEWDFDGMVVSDWGASNNAVAAVAAGGSLEMPNPGLASAREIVAAVREGRLSESAVTERARDVARCAARCAARIDEGGMSSVTGCGAIDNRRDARLGSATSGIHEDPGYSGDLGDTEAHHRLARRVVEESMVLLRNESVAHVPAGVDAMSAAEGAFANASSLDFTAPVLPLRFGTRVALIGDMAARPRFQGSGSSAVNATRDESLVGVLESASGGAVTMAGFAAGYRRDGVADAGLVREAVALARRDDVDAVVAVVGLDDRSEAEGVDRADMRMPATHGELMEALVGATGVSGKPLIAVLVAGSPVELPWIDGCSALLYAGLGGQAAASAVARILCGAVNPSGRLAETWPLTGGDAPCAADYPACDRDAVYAEGLGVGYRHYLAAGVPVCFPFGFGLSYTRFSYADLSVTPTEASFTVTNTGDVAGAAVPQLYVRGLHDARESRRADAPDRELKGFAKVWLEPGASRCVTIPFDRTTFRYWCDDDGENGNAGGNSESSENGGVGGECNSCESGSWHTRPLGAVDILIGESCEDIRLSQTRQTAGNDVSGNLPGGDVRDGVFGASAPIASPSPSLLAHRRFTSNDPFSSWADSPNLAARWWAHRLMRQARLAQRRNGGAPDLDALFTLNMPPRALAKLTNGMIDSRAARALVDVPNGKVARGLVRFVAAIARNALENRRTAVELRRQGVR